MRWLSSLLAVALLHRMSTPARPPGGRGSLNQANYDLGNSQRGSIDEETLSMHNPFAPTDVLNQGGRDLSCWELGIRIDIPKFGGSTDPSEFLDWISSVEEILDFKEIPDPRRVGLVETRLLSRASAWWQQLKRTRLRHGKPKIVMWAKFRKHIEREFLPLHYEHSLYLRLQGLHQGTRSIAEYSEEFYTLISRIDLHETPEQLVTRYISGLRVNFQDTLSLFALVDLGEAHQCALLFEKQLSHRQAAVPSRTPSPATPAAGAGSSSGRQGAPAPRLPQAVHPLIFGALGMASRATALSKGNHW